VGIYTIGSRGTTRLLGTTTDAHRSKQYLTLTEKGDLGRLRQVVKLQVQSPDPEEATVLPGAAESLARPLAITRYRGCFEWPGHRALPERPNVDIGAVLAWGCRVKATPPTGAFLLEHQGRTFLLTFRLSCEGLHVRCFSLPARQLLEHYYYYLGYEVDPTCQEPAPRPGKAVAHAIPVVRPPVPSPAG
jgi:hypothetical protein